MTCSKLACAISTPRDGGNGCCGSLSGAWWLESNRARLLPARRLGDRIYRESGTSASTEPLRTGEPLRESQPPERRIVEQASGNNHPVVGLQLLDPAIEH